MTVREESFEWNQGEDFEFTITYAIDGTAVDLTGFDARMDIAPYTAFGYGKPLLTLNSAGEETEMTLTNNGNIVVRVDRQHTYGVLGVGRDTVLIYAYDLFLRERETQKQKLLLRGQIVLNRSVTQWL